MATGESTPNEGLSSARVPSIDSIPNFRILCTRPTSACDLTSPVPAITDIVALYRSSKPDRLIEGDLEKFRNLGIKSIIDFRSEGEYRSSKGHRTLDKEYALYVVKIPKRNYEAGQSVQYVPIKESLHKEETKTEPVQRRRSSSADKRHYLINFFTSQYVFAVLRKLPYHLWCLGLLYVLWDLIRRNHFKTFKQFFVQRTLNSKGIFGQYVDIVEFSQPSICSALKLIADPRNLPALINCAHGKDRTGLVSALVLTCLGAPKSYVAEEYAMSTEGLEPVKRQVYEDIVENLQLSEEFCYARASTMGNLITYIEDRYQSVENYMEHIGFSKEEQTNLRKNLEAFDYIKARCDFRTDEI